MAFIIQSLETFDPMKLGYRAAQSVWGECAIDDSRDAIVMAQKIHHSVYPDQGFELFIGGKRIGFGFSHERKSDTYRPEKMYFEARWVVTNDMPEHEELEISSLMAEAIECLCGYSLTANDCLRGEIRIVAEKPSGPPNLEQVISKVNTLVQLCYTVEVASGQNASLLASSSAFQVGVVKRLREVILGNTHSRHLILNHPNSVVDLSRDARLALEWWKQSEH